jgi:hypothetical protein
LLYFHCCVDGQNTTKHDTQQDASSKESKEHLVAAIEKMDAKIDANQEKTDANLKELKADQEHLKEETMAKLDVHHERMMYRVDSQLEKLEAMVSSKKG